MDRSTYYASCGGVCGWIWPSRSLAFLRYIAGSYTHACTLLWMHTGGGECRLPHSCTDSSVCVGEGTGVATSMAGSAVYGGCGMSSSLDWKYASLHRLILTGPVRDRISDIFVCFARPPSSTSDPDI